MNESLKNAINKHIDFSDDEFVKALPNITLKNPSRKDYLLKAGELCDFIGFVKKGLFRSYYTDLKGNERVLQFFPEKTWICDHTSLATLNPSSLNIQAMEDSEVFLFERKLNPKAFEKSSRFRFLIGGLAQEELIRIQSRYIDSMTLSAVDRYNDLVKSNPKLLQRIPQNQIASYLGISATFLSLLKKRMIKK